MRAIEGNLATPSDGMISDKLALTWAGEVAE
jgi:hypothetical protein